MEKKMYELIDNRQMGRYEFHVDGITALIDYRKTGGGIVRLTHTEVPGPLQNRGVGRELVRQSLEDIERQGLRVVPSCSFVAAYVKRHPEWERILAPGAEIL